MPCILGVAVRSSPRPPRTPAPAGAALVLAVLCRWIAGDMMAACEALDVALAAAPDHRLGRLLWDVMDVGSPRSCRSAFGTTSLARR